MSAKSWRSEAKVFKYEYDFDVQGGAIGKILLGNLPDNFVVSDVDVFMETALTSGGAATITVGEDGAGDVDGYIADFFAVTIGTLTAGAGALISGKHLVAAALDGVQVDILTAALTAGKFTVYVRGYQA